MGGGRMTDDILNLIADPRFKSGNWTVYNASAQRTLTSNSLNVTNTGSADSFAAYLIPDCSEYRGVNMTFACSLTWVPSNSLECTNGLLFAYDAKNQWNMSDGGKATVGRKVLQFTLPGDTTGLTLRLYAPAVNGGLFQWHHPILTRTEDYRRMLSGTGMGNPVDYFDGDTRPE